MNVDYTVFSDARVSGEGTPLHFEDIPDEEVKKYLTFIFNNSTNVGALENIQNEIMSNKNLLEEIAELLIICSEAFLYDSEIANETISNGRVLCSPEASMCMDRCHSDYVHANGVATGAWGVSLLAGALTTNPIVIGGGTLQYAITIWGNTSQKSECMFRCSEDFPCE